MIKVLLPFGHFMVSGVPTFVYKLLRILIGAYLVHTNRLSVTYFVEVVIVASGVQL